MNGPKIAVIAAERGGFVRAAPLIAELRERTGCQPHFIFAGEEYVPHASSELFRDLGMPFADAVIGASEGTPAHRLAKVMVGCERAAGNPELGAVVLVGSSHTILACAIACAQAAAVVAHAEAGLRTPGIAGRTSVAAQIDAACGMLLAPSEQAHDRLLDEGADEGSVVLAGSLACDAVAQCIERARAHDAPARAGLERKGFGFAVIEAPDHIEHLANLRKVADILTQAQELLPIALNVHPRLVRRLESWQLAREMAGLPQLVSVEPRGYVDYLALLDSARVVLTDVGGVQDEATFLGVPCLTLGETTDRAATVDSGNNTLIGLDPHRAVQALEAVSGNEYPRPTPPAAWDGRASSRIADALLQAAEGRAPGRDPR